MQLKEFAIEEVTFHPENSNLTTAQVKIIFAENGPIGQCDNILRLKVRVFVHNAASVEKLQEAILEKAKVVARLACGEFETNTLQAFFAGQMDRHKAQEAELNSPFENPLP